MEFEKFQKIPRLGSKRDQMIITEKIDGTNAQVMIEDGEIVGVGSRNRVITPGKQTDNYGFARHVYDNADEFLKLGDGRHYGEWWGSGIQRGYLKTNGEKHFSIFNTARPADTLPSLIKQVPILYHGTFDTHKIREVMEDLWDCGSHLVPDQWFKPEGIIVFQLTSRQLFKLTFEHAEGKWNHA